MLKNNGDYLNLEKLFSDPLDTAAIHLSGDTVFNRKREQEEAEQKLNGVALAAGSGITSRTVGITAVTEQQLELL